MPTFSISSNLWVFMLFFSKLMAYDSQLWIIHNEISRLSKYFRNWGVPFWFYRRLSHHNLNVVNLQMYAAAGTVQNNYVNILWMLLRLRQACDHPMLVKKCAKSEALQKTTLEAVRKLPPHQRAALIQCLEGGRAICYICQVCSLNLCVLWKSWVVGNIMLLLFLLVENNS